MTDQKNQQQQPRQGKNDNNKGQSGTNAPGTGKGNDPHKNDPHKNDPHKMAKKQSAPDPDEEPETEADFNPDKSTQIGDDPEQTKKKIPNMNK